MLQGKELQMTNDDNRTREELIAELEKLRQYVVGLETSTNRTILSEKEACVGVLDTMLEGCQIIGPDWRYLYVNDAVARHGRLPKENLLGHKITEVYPGIEKTEVFTFMQRCMQEHIPHNMENEFIFPEGDRGWFELRIQPVPQGIFLLSIDITEKKKFQDALRENEEKLQLFIDYSPVILAMFDLDMCYIAASQRWLKTYNITDKDFIGRSHYDLFPEIPEQWKEAHRRGLAGEIVTADDDKFISEDGSIQWGRWEVHPWHTADDNIGGIIIFVEDITPQKQALEKIQESEAKFRTIVEQTPAITYIAALDDHSTTLYISPQIEEIIGFSPQEHKEDYDIWYEQLHPEDRERVLATIKKSHQTGNRNICEYRMFRKDGKVVWFRDVADLVKNEAGEALFLQGLMIDITDHKQSDEKIKKYTSRIESLLEVGKAVSSTLDLNKILDIMMLELRKYCPYDSISVHLYNGQNLEIIACQGFKRPDEIIGIKLPMETGYPNYEIIKSKEPMAIEDLGLEYPLSKDEVNKYDVDDIHSWLGVPMISKDTVVGMFTLDRSTVEPFSEEEIRMASAIAGHAVLAIKNAQLYKEADQRLNKLKALQLIDHAITSSFDIKVMLNVLLEQVITHLKVDAADVLIFDPYQSNLIYAAGSGFSTSSIKASRLRIGESYSGRAALERRPFHIPDIAAASPPLARSTMMADENFVSFYTQPLISKGEIRGVLEIFHRTRLNVTAEWIDDLKTFGGQAAIAIENTKLFDNLMRTNMDLTLAYDATIEGWSRIVELRTGETEGHTQRVTDLTVQLAQKMGISEKDLIQVRRGAMLHDFGKLSIPDAILFKKGKLTDQDWQIVKQYPEFAFNMLSKINYLHDALDIPYCHHENWDGTGYPRGLKGEDIPLAARIFTVANAWDSLLSGRPYREPLDEEKSLAFILEKSGKYFDPHVVQTFMLMLGKSDPDSGQ